MNITRQNYEEYFLLYVDNELSIAERKAVDAFIQQHPDLHEELKDLQRSVLRIDKQVHFENKEALLKNVPANPVNEINYEEYFVLYGDDELSSVEKEQVEQFVYKHPQYQAEFELILQAKLVPDNTISFPDKTYLYRTEDSDKVVAFRWWRVIAAAVVILFLGSASLYLIRTHGDSQDVKGGVATKLDKVDTNSSSTAGVSRNQGDKKTEVVADVTSKSKPASINDISAPDSLQLANITKVTDKHFVWSINTPKKNNIKKDSNIVIPQNVQQKTEVVAVLKHSEVEPDEVNSTVEAKPVISVRPEINATNLIAQVEPVADENGWNNGGDNGYTETDNKKNKMRGLFRRVTRVFDKATSAEPNDNGKSGVRIASFAVALK